MEMRGGEVIGITITIPGGRGWVGVEVHNHPPPPPPTVHLLRLCDRSCLVSS